ncbi:hypothetical protein ACTXOR_10410 [Arthrobacter rhombi]|uniref:hypothetical protein n=1 Tax=Arthrobacter rhombi TaxID=71253 RepID=UPI003FD24F17
MHHGQIPIDVPTAQALIRQQFPHLGSEPIRFLPSTGTVNAIFRVGDLLAARFPLHESDPAELAESLRAEADAMDELAGRSPVPTPTCVGLLDVPPAALADLGRSTLERLLDDPEVGTR